MADRVFERAFNRAMHQPDGGQQPRPSSRNAEPAAASTSVAEGAAPKPQEGASGVADAPLRAGEPGASEAAIDRITAAWKDKDYFRLLGLPPPEVDELGRPTWSVNRGEVSRAYRRLSVLVHPDKHPGPEARAAFDALSAAHKALTDPGQLEEALKASLADAIARRDAAESAASLGERIVLQAQKQEKAKELAKHEGESFQAEIMRQIREKQGRARWKKQARARSRRDSDDEDNLFKEEPEPGGARAGGGGGGGEKEEDSDGGVQRFKKNKKKPRIIF